MKTFSLALMRDIWGNAGFQRYFQNTGWLFASRLLTLIISFIATVFIARNLGPTNYGQLSYALSFISIFSFLASLGIDNIVYRDLIKHQDRKEMILGSALAIKLVAGGIAAFVAIFSASFFVKDVSTTIIIILSGTFIFNAFQIINYQFQAQSQSQYPATITVIVSILLNALKITSIYFNKGVLYLAIILLFESILYAFFFLYVYNRKYVASFMRWSPNWNTIISILKDSWPLIFSGAFMLIYSRIDQIFIKQMMDARAVGIYDAAVRLAEVWYFIPGIIVTVLFPAIINAKAVSEELYVLRIKKLGLFLTSIAVGVAAIVTALAPFAIRTIYGPDFLESISVLQIYVWAGVGIFLGTLANHYLITENYRKILFVISLIPMLSNVALNLLWIPKFGIQGAAYASLISYSLIPLTLLLFKQTRHIFTFSKKAHP